MWGWERLFFRRPGRHRTHHRIGSSSAKMIIELLLPLSPSGALESLAKNYGLEKSRFIAEPTACILCGLCVRYCAEIKKANAIGFIGRGIERTVAFLPEVAPSVCPMCDRECLALCPSGKLAWENPDGILFPPLPWQREQGADN